MIFKLQKDLISGTKVLVKEKRGKFGGEIPMTSDIDKLFHGRNKVYVNGKVDKSGRLCIISEVRASF